jgi:hypothetical protein
MDNPYDKKLVCGMIFLFFLAANGFSANGSSQGGGNAATDDDIAMHKLVIVKPPAGGRIDKLRITNANNGRIVLDNVNIAQKRLILLPKGVYDVENASNKSRITINGEGIIFLKQNKFVFEETVPPPVITFMRGNQWDLTTLTEGVNYHLTFFDINNLDTLPPNSYKIHISGPDMDKDIPLDAITQNSRFISANPLMFTRGTFKITASLGSVNLSPPRNITVVPKPPFVLTITNRWNNNALQYADIQYFKTSAALAKNIAPEMSKTNFDAFVYSNRNNIDGNMTVNTGGDGKISLRGVHNNDRILIFLKGVMPGDPIYIKSITVDEDNPAMYISWENVPSKGKGFDIETSIDSSALSIWSKIDSFSVSLYYRPGNPATIRRQTVLNASPPWTTIKNANFRREADDRITIFADFSGICKATHINYLIVVTDEDQGNFSMNNTADEFSIQPRLFKE